jgi:hypothetical protein
MWRERARARARAREREIDRERSKDVHGFRNKNLYILPASGWVVASLPTFKLMRRVALIRMPCYFINFLPTSLSYMYILLTRKPSISTMRSRRSCKTRLYLERNL